MNRANNIQYSSDFGFKSPRFRVDENGNIFANSLVLESEATDVIDFVLSDGVLGNIVIDGFEGTNPAIEIEKARTYTFQLNLNVTELFFVKENQTDVYVENLIHNSGDVGADAQGKQTGIYRLRINSIYDEDIIYYTDRDRTFFGTINILDPKGVFDTVEVNSTLDTISLSTGALTISGGVALAKNLRVGNTIFAENITLAQVLSSPNVETEEIRSDELTINSQNGIRILASDSTVLGNIGDTGSSIPLVDTQIDNTVIGAITPSTAFFADASVNSPPATNESIANKQYVDNTVTALSIALGS